MRVTIKGSKWNEMKVILQGGKMKIMKRTGEYIVSVIGIILSALMAGLGFIFISFNGSEEVKQVMGEEVANNPALSTEDLTVGLELLESFGTLITVASIAGAVLGLVAVFILRSKKPKAAGILFILAALAVGLISIGLGIIPALLFLIAGIMCLARRPKIESYVNI
jgi:hypothetical protein